MTESELKLYLDANNQAMMAMFQNLMEKQMQQFQQVLGTATSVFYQQGYNDGSAAGYVTAVNSLKPAISDGLRHGSSECGKVMQSFRDLGLADDEEK
ncbi:hypothetical protein HLB27_01250 [Dickeya dadantii]|uniref:hypothetical protein n=1 Tax=Dickeya dadantii TaxID=204038 RepID=UPI0014954D22|nr:hypothetical protein [Dickeya dadantii]NPE59177.1 hypothetical protein [Dickeya dadantii]NPE69441.1 hypothetical protein [Dickeya dadantii]